MQLLDHVSIGVPDIDAVRPFYDAIMTALGASKVVHIPKRPGEPDCTWADITKITTELDWHPTVEFDDGVNRILAEIDHWRDAPVWTPETIAAATKEWFTHLGEQKVTQPGETA